MSCSKRIKRFDDLGHQVKINFNRQGETVTTVWGSLVSIITRIIIYIYLVIKLKTMFFNDNNSISLSPFTLEGDSFGNKTIGEMEILFYMELKHTSPFWWLQPINLDKFEMDKVFDVSFQYEFNRKANG